MNIILTIVFALFGGLIYRIRGGGFNLHIPNPVPQLVFALPFALAAGLHWGWPVGLLVLGLTTLAACMGHGEYQDLGTWKLTTKPERVDFLIRWLHGRIPEYWYDAMGLSLTGLLITLPAGVALHSPLLAVSGLLKAVAYMIGWKWGDTTTLIGPGAWLTRWARPLIPIAATEIGEFLTGVFLYAALALLK